MNRIACRGLVLAAAALATVAPAGAGGVLPAGALTPAPAVLKDCDLPDILPGKTLLETGCRYTRPIEIDRDNVILDCRGATIEGMHKRGVTIRPGLKNITVRDCRLHDTGGILIEGQTPEDDAPARDAARAASSTGVCSCTRRVTS